jgi:hypothetical protein
MVCAPTASVVVAKVAMPVTLRVPVPRVVAPSLKVTVPEGVPLLGAVALTVAVNVTLEPMSEGFDEEAMVVADAPLFTTCERLADVLVAKLVSPAYTALSACVPTVNVEVENVATPAAFSKTVPSVVAPSEKVTLPVMVPAIAEVTVAVSVVD